MTDACILLEAIAGKYPSGQARPDHRKLRKIARGDFVSECRRNSFSSRIEPEVRRLVEAAAKKFESLGARVEQVSLPRLPGAIDQASQLVVAEINDYHESQGYFPARAAEYGDDVRGHLEWGHKLFAVDYLRGIPKRPGNHRGFSGGV